MPVSVTATERFRQRSEWNPAAATRVVRSSLDGPVRPRFMDPATGRFITLDPFGAILADPQSLHKYNYAESDPVNKIDPSGLWSLSAQLSSIGSGARLTVSRLGVGLAALQRTQAFEKAAIFSLRVRRFFWDPRSFRTISRAYWSGKGGAGGRSLHHWLMPQRANWIPQGLRNAGFNLFNMPRIINTPVGGLNQWMGFAMRWGGRRMVVAVMVDSGIKVAIPVASYTSYQAGRYLGKEIADELFFLDDGAEVIPLDLSREELMELEESARKMFDQLESGEFVDQVPPTL